MIMRPKQKTQKNPYEVVLCILFGLSGSLSLFTVPSVASTASTLPTNWRILWLGMAVCGCFLTLVGVFSRYVWGYFLEQVGLVATGGTLIAYGCQVVVIQIQRDLLSPSTVTGGPLLIGLGIAFLWHWFQLQKYVKELGKVEWKFHR